MNTTKFIVSVITFMGGGIICDVMKDYGVQDPFIFMMFGCMLMFFLERVKFVSED